MSSKPKVILVEDDRVISELVAFNLEEDGFTVQAYRTGTALFQDLGSIGQPALFILDLMLPGMDGYEICTRLRRDKRFTLTPIILLTARGTESDKVRGLDAGADDYLTKPFGMRELLARVRAQTRRHQKILKATGHTTEDTAPDEPHLVEQGRIACCNIALDDVRHRVFRDGDEIEMTHREYELLKHLMLHRGVAFSREDLLNSVWGYDYGGETRTVDVHIRQLRRKLEQDDANPILIQTVRGRGYRFTDLDT